MPSRICRVQLLQTSVAKVRLCCYLVRFAIKFCFVLDTHDTGHYCYKQAMQVKFHVFYCVLNYKSAAWLSGIF